MATMDARFEELGRRLAERPLEVILYMPELD
jgi:hypothetical protein